MPPLAAAPQLGDGVDQELEREWARAAGSPRSSGGEARSPGEADPGTPPAISGVWTVQAFDDIFGPSAGITMEYRHKLNAAMVHCGFPVVPRMIITAGGLEELIDLIVTLQVPLYSQPWSKTLPRLEPGQRVVLKDIPLQLDYERLSRLKEADTTTQIVVTVARQGTPISRESYPITVLAFNEWRRDPDLPLLEAFRALAAFVMPNSSAIEQVLTGAAQILLERTKDDSLPGYQAGPRRVHHIGAAVFDSCRDICKIGYIDPPPSFEVTEGKGEGQKVFLPHDVVRHRRGTCLDLALLLAACYERTGLHPVVFVIPGHAFVGIWVDENGQMPAAVSEDSVQVLWERSRRRLLAIEATAMAKDASFEQAIQAADGNLMAAVGRTIAIDIQMARNEGFRPLPVPAG